MMIKVEGYKAFHGVMRITPKNKQFPTITLECDWLYKPEHDCWYGDGRSFPAEICEVIEE